MQTLLHGFLQFRAWLPDPLLELADPGERVDRLHLRTALALAIAVFLWSFVSRTLWYFGLTLHDWLAGRRLVRERQTGRSVLAWLLGLGAVGLPWLALWRAAETGQVAWRLFSLAALCGVLWAALRITGRDRVFWLPTADCLVVATARPGLETAELRIALAPLWPQPGATSALLPAEVVRELGPSLGGERAALRYLERVRRKRRVAVNPP